MNSADQLKALWEAYINADMDVREVERELLEGSRRFKDAEQTRDEAWEKYRATKAASEKSA